jgi:hypothetical protein
MNFVFFFVLGAYLFEIVPQEFGVTRKAYFPFSMVKKFFQRKVNKDARHSDTVID